MAATKIADVIVPEVFNPYVVQRTAELSAFYQSGIIQTVDGLNVLGLRGGTTIALPFFKDLTGEEEILSDTAPLGVDKITSAQDIAVLHARGKAWGVNDLARALSGADPMGAIADMTAAYWARRWQALILAELEGVFKSASMAGNVLDISGETGDAAVASSDTMVDAAYLLGDAASILTGYAMHSATLAYFVKLGLAQDEMIDYEGNIQPASFMGKRVIVDDGMPVASGVHTVYMFGQGAIGYGEGNAPVPTETDRDSLQGEDILINRAHFVMHPRGVRWIGTSSGVSPTNAELRVGTNWERVYENKQIRVVQVKFRTAAAA